MTAARLVAQVRDGGKGGNARCPAHEDNSPSLSVGQGRDGGVVVKCHAGCTTEAVVAAVDLDMLDLAPPGSGEDWTPAGPATATYTYIDENGETLYGVARTADKQFRQFRPDDTSKSGRRWSVKGVRKVPYRLPQILAAVAAGQTIYIVEGEKDVHAVEKAGAVATCNAGGAGKWDPSFAKYLAGADVVVVADRDEPGYRHAFDVAQSLTSTARSVRTVEAVEGKDAADHLAAGHNLDELASVDLTAFELTTIDGPAKVERDGTRPTPLWSQHGGSGKRRLIAPPSDPLPNAELFVRQNFHHPDVARLVSHGGAFHQWDGTRWPEIEDAGLRRQVYMFLRDADYEKKGEHEPFQPNRRKVVDLLDALHATTHLPREINPPAWIGEEGPAPADEVIAVRNGLLHWPARTLHEHTPTFYAHHSVPFGYKPDAPVPAAWLAFLHDLWGDDEQRIAALAEIFGYLLSGATDQQKMFLLVGPKRSGKGTIARVLTALLGPHNVAGPTLVGLGTNFGLSPLIAKAVAIVSDARIKAGADVVTERLLAISGEDTLTVDRKYRDPWTGRIPARFVILSNELPRLNDSSGALASRFLMLTFERSFYGREDTGLTERLLTELPGILNWALDGLARLQRRGNFDQPDASRDALVELEDLGSPIGAFVRDRCAVRSGAAVPCDDLYRSWRNWCDEHGRDHPGTAQTFARDLRAAIPGLKTTQPRAAGGSRYRQYEGIKLGGDNNAPVRVPSRSTTPPEPLERGGTRPTPMLSQPDGKGEPERRPEVTNAPDLAPCEECGKPCRVLVDGRRLHTTTCAPEAA